MKCFIIVECIVITIVSNRRIFSIRYCLSNTNYRFIYGLVNDPLQIRNIGIKIRNLYTIEAENYRDLRTVKEKLHFIKISVK